MIDRVQREIPTEEEKASLKYLQYPTKPVVYDAREAIPSGLIERRGDDILVRLDPRTAEFVGTEKVLVPPDDQYSLIEATVFGLNEATSKAGEGTNLRNAFMEEFSGVIDQMGESDDEPMDYGAWVFNPREKKLLHFANKYWHRLALSLTNSTLLLDPDKNMTFWDVRQKLENSTVAVIGLSVGSNAAKAIIQDLRPESIIVADPAFYKLTNLNRVALRADEMVLSNKDRARVPNMYGLRPKWQVFAEQTNSIDPWLDIYCYPQADQTNMGQFIGGNRVQPKADIVVEVCDTTGVKIQAAEEARQRGVPFVRITDAGSRVSVDIRRFDKDRTLPITVGVSDLELHRLSEMSGRSRADFFKFANALIGDFMNGDDEFADLVTGRKPAVSSSVPQIGSTATVAGGWTAELVGRMLLGHSFPERIVLDLHKLTMQTYGSII